MPLRLEAAILSRTRSPISSRSNWANDSSTLSVSRPMLELVLKDWVTDTNETPWTSNSSMSLAKSASERVSRSTLYTSTMSILLARTFGQELLQRRAVERGAGECAVVVAAGDQPPAFVRLALYICLAGLALGVERVEGKLEIVLGGLARIDGAVRELADRSVHATRPPMTHERR